MGGYVSGPGGIAARLTGVPLIIHEQNSVAGLTNRKLAKLAKRVLEAFPGSFGEGYQAIHTGNPLREGFIASEADRDEEAGRDNNVPANRPFHLLVVGGSQGAAILNQVVPDALGLYQGSRDLWVRHQCGRGQVEALGRNYQGVEGRIEVVEFIEEMAQAYRWADVVICRAGAMTIAELAASGKASVLIPLPSAVDDHQTGNARYLSDKDAAILLPQSELDAKKLASYLKELAEHPERLMKMGQKARDAALPEATQNVVKQCLEVLQ
jgi:UDP-N-acetylglucosamine--N-acetylmuramyl-(pentapeptide) pyrophosphoryl-undecaprenol N-acetylglucosamine transferase